MDFFPETNFVDVGTLGYENVKDKTDIKVLRFSAPSSSQLSEKIKNYSKNASISTIPTRTSPQLSEKIKNYYKNASISSRTTDEINELSNKFRHAVLYSTVDDLINVLSETPTKFVALSNSPPKLCFLITCQATQYGKMGQELYAWSPVFRQYFDECDAIIKENYKLSVKNLMNSDDSAWVSNPLEALPYILALEYALFKLWESWGIKPDIVLGMSFGEYGAAVISGIISLKDAVRLIMTRTQLVTDHIEEEAFGAIEMDYSRISEILEELKKEDGMQDAWLDVACVNSPLQTCVVGLRRYVHKFVGMFSLQIILQSNINLIFIL